MTDDDESTPWVCDSEEKATWAVHQVARADADVARAKAQAAIYVEKVRREAEATRAFFQAQLELYYAEHPPAKGKQVKTAAGVFGFRKVPGGLSVDDEEAAIAWAVDELPGAVTRVSRIVLDRNELKRGVPANLAPPGCSRKPDEERFYVRPMSVKGGDDE